ncbi:hypothetical protein [Klebsiella phage 05F01]|nr:hypothetical protein [Klebsiella phage 05F01]
MKVMAIFNCDKNHCSSFVAGKEYLAYDLLQCPPDSNMLLSNGLVVIDEDGDAITSDDAYRIWDIKFEEV